MKESKLIGQHSKAIFNCVHCGRKTNKVFDVYGTATPGCNPHHAELQLSPSEEKPYPVMDADLHHYLRSVGIIKFNPTKRWTPDKGVEILREPQPPAIPLVDGLMAVSNNMNIFMGDTINAYTD